MPLICNKFKNELIRGVWTFNQSPIVPQTPTTATQAASKGYVDAIADAVNLYQYKGAIDCSGSPNYPAASAGHGYIVSVAGLIGGGAGPAVQAGDMLFCITDASAAGNHAAVGANWKILQTNIASTSDISEGTNLYYTAARVQACVAAAGAGFTGLVLGDIFYSSAANTLAVLSGNITVTKKFLTQTGTGAVSAAPAWDTLVSGDIPNNAANTSGNAATATALQHTKTLATSDNVAYTCTDTSIAAYADGQLYQFKMPAADCGASPSLNITGSGGAIGAKGIYKDMTTACGAGDLKASAIYIMMYNSAAAAAAGAFVMSGSVPAAASTTVAGIVELTIASEVDTGTSTTLVITPDALAGSNLGKRSVPFQVVHPAVLLEVGDNQLDFPIPPELSGMNLIGITMEVDTASSGAAPSFSIERVRTGAGAGTVNVLTTNVTIDAAELTSLTAATPTVINTSNDDVVASATTQDRYRFNCDVAGTDTKGWKGSLAFQLP